MTTEAGAEKVLPNTIEMTLAERGMMMPLGLQDAGGALTPHFTVKPWRMAEEKELAKQQSEGGDNLATYVSNVIAFMCEQLGSHAMGPMKPAERRLAVSQMFMGDVWYVYASIRRAALGDELKLNLRCPRCRADISFTASLGTLAVRTAPTVDACMWSYELLNPIKVRGKQVDVLHLGPQRWYPVESAHADQNTAQAKELGIRASLYRINDAPERVQLVDGELDQLSKRDFETLVAMIDERFIGPNMALDVGKDHPCLKCGFSEPRRIPIDWRYDSFFGVSSR